MVVRSVEAIPLACDLGAGAGVGGARGGSRVRTATLVRVETGDGAVGYGEAFAPPSTVATLVEELLADAVVGMDPAAAGSLADRVYAGDVAGYHFARGPVLQSGLSGVEVALWDLRGRVTGEPVHRLLGGRSRESVTPYASTMYFGEGSDDPAAAAREAAADGFTAAKVKVGAGVADDVARVEAARDHLGADAHLMVDYNGNYAPKRALRSLRALAPYDLTWAEEPVPPEDLAGYRELRGRVEVPLAAGEAHFGRFDLADLLTDRVVDVLQPNLGRCGGFAEARFLARLATTENAAVRPHVWNSGVGLAAALQFAATLPDYPHATDRVPEPVLFEYDRSENPLREGLLVDPFDPTGGELAVPDGPGLGVDVDESAVERFRIG